MSSSLKAIKAKNCACHVQYLRHYNESYMDSNLVEGKILVIDSDPGRETASRFGAIGVITSKEKIDDTLIVPLPSSALTTEDYDVVKSFINSTE